MSTFYAAVLVDPLYKKEFPIYQIDAESRESTEQAIDAITHSNHTPEQIKGMLGAVRAKSEEIFSDEEKTNLFGEAEPRETPFEIELTKDNFQVFYAYAEQTKDAALESELEARVAELASKLAQAEGIISESESLMFENVVPYQDLPLAEKDTSWDEGEARKAIKSWAGEDSDGKVNHRKYVKAFVWYDGEAEDSDGDDLPETDGSYKFPIATVVDGILKAVPRGIYAAAGRLSQSKIPATDKPKIQAHLDKYYKKLGEAAPWDEESPETDDTSAEVERLKAEIETRDATIESLRAAVAALKSFQHESLAKEAAGLALDLGKPIAQGKTFDELCLIYASRTDDSIKDTISDLKLEASNAGEGTTPVLDAEPVAVTEQEAVGDGTVKLPDEGFIEDLKTTIEIQESDVWSIWLGPDGTGKAEIQDGR